MNLFACLSLITLRFNEGGRSERHKSVMTRSPICRLLLAMIESFTSNLSSALCGASLHNMMSFNFSCLPSLPRLLPCSVSAQGFPLEFGLCLVFIFDRAASLHHTQFASHHSLARPSLECPHHSTTICDGDVIEPRSARSLEWSRVFVYINCTFSLLLSIVFCGIDIWNTLTHSLVRSAVGSCVRRCLFVKVNA